MEEGERPDILNIGAWRNYLATFDRQQLATLKAAALRYLICLIYRVWFTIS